MNKFTRSLAVIGATALSLSLGAGTLAQPAPDTSDNEKGVQVTVTNPAGVFAFGFSAPETNATGSAQVDIIGNGANANLSANVLVLDTRSSQDAFDVALASGPLTGDGGGTISNTSVSLDAINTGTDVTSTVVGSPVLTYNSASAALDSAKTVVSKGTDGNVDLNVGIGITVAVPAGVGETYTGTLTLSGTSEVQP